jgi:hypothetical protein
MVRHFFLGVCIRIRLDRDFAHFAAIVILDVEPNLEYVVRWQKMLCCSARPTTRP